MSDERDIADLRRLVEALEPFLSEVVIVGGWAYRLYRLREEVVVPAYKPVFTVDTDVVLPNNIGETGDAILDRLTAAGFVEKYFGEDRPPVTHYQIASAHSDFYAEFLTPVSRSRAGRAQETVVIGGVVAQALQYLDILMIAPWRVLFIDQSDDASFTVRVPNPVSFIAQKLLVLKKRRTDDRAKDILYMNDTLELFGGRLDSLNETWRKEVRPNIGSVASEVMKLAQHYFATVTDDVRRAALVAGTRRLDPETLRTRCDVGLSIILGD